MSVMQRKLTLQDLICSFRVVDAFLLCRYSDVKNHCKGRNGMRKHYLDNIRWITGVIVVIYHVLYMYNSEGILGGLGRITDLPVQHYDILMYLVYPWFMPVLFLVSGISAKLYLDHHTDREFIKTRTDKLLVPSTLGLFVFQFIQGYVSMSLGNAFDQLSAAGVPGPVQYLIMVASGSGVLWFLHLLWIYSILLVWIRKMEKGRVLRAAEHTPVWMILLFVFPVWGAAQILNAPVVSVYRCAFYLVFFLLGYYVFSHEAVIEKLKKHAPVWIAAGVMLCISFAVLNFYVRHGANYADKPVNRSLLYAACAYYGTLAVLAGAARYLDFRTPFTAWMSRKSFGLYVFHYLGISACALVFAKPGLASPPLCYLLSLVSGFAFGYGLYEIISRIPVYRYWVLGIRKEKKHVQ